MAAADNDGDGKIGADGMFTSVHSMRDLSSGSIRDRGLKPGDETDLG